MDKKQVKTIKNIKIKIIKMLKERQQLLKENNKNKFLPGKFWSDYSCVYKYMLGLKEEDFTKLRHHTYHLTGDIYLTYKVGDPQAFRESVKLDDIIKNIPEKYILNEPREGIGFKYKDGRFISQDIIRFQKIINTFYRQKIISELLKISKERRAYILEIGGGYGGLAHHLSKIIKNSTYIIIDLPETLIFSAAYLNLLNPKKKIYLYDKKDFKKFVKSEKTKNYDFILLPNYILDFLNKINFDLVISVASFQEMETTQVEKYINFIHKNCKGILYSCNMDKYELNKDLSKSLTDIIKKRFKVKRVLQPEAVKSQKDKLKAKIRKLLTSLAIFIGLLDKPKKGVLSQDSYQELICIPIK